MKTFTATHLNKHAQEVFDEVKEYGSAAIEHDRYRGGVFAIVWNPDMAEDEMLLKLSGGTSIDINKGDFDIKIDVGPEITSEQRQQVRAYMKGEGMLDGLLATQEAEAIVKFMGLIKEETK